MLPRAEVALRLPTMRRFENRFSSFRTCASRSTEQTASCARIWTRPCDRLIVYPVHSLACSNHELAMRCCRISSAWKWISTGAQAGRMEMRERQHRNQRPKNIGMQSRSISED